MAEKALTAILSAQETISESLASVADALDEVAESAGVSGEAMDSTEDAADEVRNAMAETSAVLQEAQEGFEGVSVEARQAAMSAEDFADAGENVRNAQMAMDKANQSAERSLAEEAQTFREAVMSAGSLEEAKDAVSRANQMLSGTAKATQDALQGEIGALYRMARAADSAEELADDLRNSELQLAESIDFAEMNIESMTSAQLANAVAARIDEEALNDLKDSIEETGDEASQTALEMAGLSGAFAATSFNLGPFNFALRQAAVQIPQLAAVTGSLAAALGGLATAAVTAGSALAAIYGGGMLAMARQMAQTNDEYKNTWEAMEGVMKEVRGTIMRALEPLANQENVEMFKDAITGLASALNLFAQLANRLRGELDAFLGELSTAFFDNANEILLALESTVEAFLPVIADFFVWFMEKLPAALEFFNTEGMEFLGFLGEFGRSFLNFFRAITEVGIAAFEGILPAIAGVLEAIRMVADILNMLPNEVIAAATAFLVLSRAMSGALSLGIRMGRFFGGLGTAIMTSRTALGAFNSVLAALHLTGAQEALGLLAQRFGMIDELAEASSETAQKSMAQISSLDITEDFSGEGVKTQPLDGLRERYQGIKSSISDTLSDAAGKARSKMGDVATAVTDGFGAAADRIRNISLPTRVGTVFEGVLSTVTQKMGEMPGIVGGFFEAAADRMRNTSFTSAASGAVGGVGEAISERLASLNRVETTTETTIPAPEMKMEALKTLDIQDADASKETIESAYRSMVKDVHPDMGGSAEAFKDVDEAKKTLLEGDFEAEAVTETRVTTRTAQARQKLSSLGETFAGVGRRARNLASNALSAVGKGLQSLAARGIGVVSVFTGVGEAAISAVPGLGNFSRAMGNIKSGLQIISPELASFASDMASKIPTSMGDATDALSGFGERLRGFSFSGFSLGGFGGLGGVTDSLPALASGSDEVAGALPAVTSGADEAASSLPVLASSADETGSIFGRLRSRIASMIPSFSSLRGAFGRLTSRFSGSLGIFGSIGGMFGDLRGKISNLSFSLSGLIPSISSASNSLSALASGSDEVAGALPAVTNSADEAANNLPVLASSADDTAGAFGRFKGILGGFLPSMDSVKSALGTAVSPITRAGGAIRSSADGFASAVSDVENYDDAMALVGRKASGVRNVISSMTGRLYKYISAVIPSTISTSAFATSMKGLIRAPIRAIVALGGLIATMWGYITGATTASLMNTTLAASLSTVSAAGIPVISTMAATALTFLGVASTSTLAAAAVAALSFALNSIGIGLILKAIAAIVAFAGILAGILSNMDGIIGGAQSAFQGLKSAAQAVFDSLIKMGVPIWNVFISILEALGAFIWPFTDAFGYLAEQLGWASENGEEAFSILGMIGDVLGFLVDVTAEFFSSLIGPLSFIADLIYQALYIPTILLIDGFVWLIDLIGKAINWFMKLGPVQQVIDGINAAVQNLIKAWDALMSMVDSVVKFVKNMVEGMVNFIIGLINGFIDMINKVPFVNIEKLSDFSFGGEGDSPASERLAGAEASAAEARENAGDIMDDDESRGQDDMAGGQQTVINTYEQNNYNFGDFNMKPEEKARVKGLVQEAIEEANRTKRLRDGGI